ncbi:MAG: hypothetical protein WC055_15890 [Melioribacteraceae bacterium]
MLILKTFLSNMKSIRVNTNITSISAKKDGSLGLRMETPELSAEEKVEFMKLQGMNLDAIFTPLDEPHPEEMKVNKELNTKSQGQRIRAVIFLLWKQSGEQESFEVFYQNKTEKIISYLKDQLE